jgi:3-hydroxyacyl-[acyl-carrier-protein] dehydratase
MSVPTVNSGKQPDSGTQPISETDPLSNPERASRTRPSPLDGLPVVREQRPGGLLATYSPTSSESVLAGHFPGFPIFPGVCLVECAHQTSLLALPADTVLVGMEQVRFLSPVFPGDEVLIDVDIAEDGEGRWRSAARLTVQRDPAAEPVDAALARLRYRTGGAHGHS